MTAFSQPTAFRSLLFGICAITILSLGVFGWGAFAQIDGAIIAPGRIEVEQDRQVVQHATGGTILELRVRNGDTVLVGDVLMVLDSTQQQKQLDHIELLLLERHGRQARLIAERDAAETVRFPATLAIETELVRQIRKGQQARFTLRRAAVSRNLAQSGRRRLQIGRQVEGMAAQHASLQEQLALIEEDLNNKLRLLERGLAQTADVLNLRRQAARINGELGALRAAEAEAKERVVELEIEAERLAVALQEEAVAELQELRLRILDLKAERAKLAAEIERSTIRAPVSGIVHGLSFTGPQAVVRAAEPLLYLVPQDRPLMVAARLPPRYVGQLSIGQDVRLQVSSQAHPDAADISGEVTTISASLVEGVGSAGPYFQVDIKLNPMDWPGLERGSLRPGMAVDAYIKTGLRSPLAYFAAPIRGYFTRAFRES